MSHPPTASQTVGPFFSIGLSPNYCEEIAAKDAQENGMTVRGRLLDRDGEAVPDAVLEIWRADAGGGQGGPSNASRADGIPLGFGRIATNERGEFRFSAQKPPKIQNPDGKLQAPHFVVLVFMRGLLRHLVTRMYFAGEAANTEDAVLQIVPEERRSTLLAQPSAKVETEWEWDIHLQGDRETVFFET